VFRPLSGEVFIINRKQARLLLTSSLFLLATVVIANGKKDARGTSQGGDVYAVSGTLSGLASGKHLVLQNNNADDLTLSADGSFTFATKLADGAAYSVTVKTQPQGQTCTVSHGSGAISGADVSNVEVSCADSGSLDTDFATNGVATFSEEGDQAGLAIVTDTTGKIIVAGYDRRGSLRHMKLWRYDARGVPDEQFGTSGSTAYDEGSDSMGKAIALDTNGAIFVAGSIKNSADWDMSLWRYKPNGELDTSFGRNGIATCDGKQGNDAGFAIALDPSGKILVAGSIHSGSKYNLALWRYSANGVLDDTFGSSGVTVFDGGQNDFASAVIIDSNGKILVTGYSFNGSSNDMILLRYNKDGTPDGKFNSTGFVTYNGGAEDRGLALAVTAAGKILVAGFSTRGSGAQMAIWRYDGSGVLDASFGVEGLARYDSSRISGGEAFLIDSMGRIAATGSIYNNAKEEMALWRFNGDGALDTNFGLHGVVTYDGGYGDDEGRAIALAPSGKIIVVGFGDNGSDNDLKIWRFIP